MVMHKWLSTDHTTVDEAMSQMFTPTDFSNKGWKKTSTDIQWCRFISNLHLVTNGNLVLKTEIHKQSSKLKTWLNICFLNVTSSQETVLSVHCTRTFPDKAKSRVSNHSKITSKWADVFLLWDLNENTVWLLTQILSRCFKRKEVNGLKYKGKLQNLTSVNFF